MKILRPIFKRIVAKRRRRRPEVGNRHFSRFQFEEELRGEPRRGVNMRVLGRRLAVAGERFIKRWGVKLVGRVAFRHSKFLARRERPGIGRFRSAT